MTDRHTTLWYHRPQRLVQTVLREIDAVNYDADSVVAYLREAHASGLVINAGGIFDFFQNPLPLANVSSCIGDRDILREITTACHRDGLRVIARVDFRGVEEDRYAAHPQWFASDPEGGPVVAPYNSIPLRVPCYNGYYRNEHAARFMQHILTDYGVDGIWHNSVLISTRCYCRRCRESFGEAGVGLDPTREGEPEYERRYQRGLGVVARRNLGRLRDAVKEVGGDKAYVAEVFNMFDVERPKQTGVDMYEASDFFDFLVSVGFLTENRPQPAFERLSYPTSLVRFLRCLDPRKQPVLLFGTNGTAYRYVRDPPEDLKVFLWENVASGGGFWNCLFNGVHPAATHDRRNAYLAAAAYAYLEENEAEIADALPLADVLVLYSKPTKDRFGSDDPDRDRAVQEVRGFERCLVAAHVQYGFVCDRDIDSGKPIGEPTLLLPNVACMSDEQCEVIRRFVSGGGTLIASFQTSLFDESGEGRDDFGLADLFGVSLREREVDTSFDRYQHVAVRDHELLGSFADTELLAMAGRACHVVPGPETEVLTTITEQIRNQPPERAWTTDLAAGMPGLCVHRYGKGTVICFAYTIGRLISIGLHPDFRELLLGAVRMGVRSGPTVETNAPSTVHVSVLGTSDAVIVNLVNHTVGELRPVESVVPVRDLRVTVKRPRMRLGFSRVLYGDAAITAEPAGSAVEIAIPELTDFASIRLGACASDRWHGGSDARVVR